MIEGIRDSAVSAGLIEPESFDAGVHDLHRTTEADGMFCYTFFKGVGDKRSSVPLRRGDGSGRHGSGRGFIEGSHMALDRSFFELNRASTDRMRALVASLTDEGMQRPVGEHWTMAITLAHLAWWDRRVMNVLDLTEHHGTLFAAEIDIVVNHLSLPLWAVIPPVQQTEIAIETAEMLDRRLESYPPALLEEVYVMFNSGYRSHLKSAGQNRIIALKIFSIRRMSCSVSRPLETGSAPSRTHSMKWSAWRRKAQSTGGSSSSRLACF